MGRIARRLGLMAVLLILVAGSGAAPSRAVSPAAAAVPPIMSTHPDYGTAFEPLRPGTRLTYRQADGGTFSREVMLPAAVQWFDGTSRKVIPVFDSRYDGYFLYHLEGDEVQVIGTWRNGKLARWGEYIVALGADALPAAVVETPAERFIATRQMQNDDGGPAWYAEGVGLVKTNDFALSAHEQVEARSSGL